MKATAQIFLSYAREDEEKVKNLYQELSDVGFRPWMAKKDIFPGEIWKSSIQRAIRRSDFFLACLSANSVNKRGFLQKEIKNALDIWQEKLDSDIYLIPVRLEDCEVPESLRDFQWVNLYDQDGWTRLVRAIEIGMDRRAEVPTDEEPSPDVEMTTPEGPERVEEDMDPLSDFLYSLPNRRYLDFVRRFILRMQDGGKLDPFAVDLPGEFADVTYVPREPITDEVRRPGTRLILGKAGIGKSAIFASLLRQAGESILPVGLHLHQVGAALPEPDVLAGEASLLTLDLLIPHIFETYWEKTIRSPQQPVKYFPQLRADKQWMELLRWFYQRYPPTHPGIDDYELMAWLRISPQAEPLRSQISPLDTLRELMRLITWKASPQRFFGSREFSQAYTEVEVLLDGTEQLSPPAVRRLVTDAQSLYDMHLDKLQFKLFMDSAWREHVASMNCVRQGRVSVVNLPPWSDLELCKLLRRRILSFQSGGSTIDPEEMPEYDLGNLLADSGSLRPEARERLESLIIAGAQGIPLHALRLGRCVVAACAGCWVEEFQPSLTLYEIERLIALYQKSAGLTRNFIDLVKE